MAAAITEQDVDAVARGICMGHGLDPDERVGCGWYDHETPAERDARLVRDPTGFQPDMLCFTERWRTYRWKAAEAIAAHLAIRQNEGA